MGTSASAVSPVPRHRKQFGWVDAHGADADNGPLYMRQRWYDPTLQRFISRDPIGLRGGANLYAYADGNPSTWNDPDGLLARPPAPAHPAVVAGSLVILGLELLRQKWERQNSLESLGREVADQYELGQNFKKRRKQGHVPTTPDYCTQKVIECRLNCLQNVEDNPDMCRWKKQYPKPPRWSDYRYYHYHLNLYDCLDDCQKAYEKCVKLGLTGPDGSPDWPPGWRGDEDGQYPPPPGGGGGRQTKAA